MENPCHKCIEHIGNFENCFCASRFDNPHWKRCREQIDIECTHFVDRILGPVKKNLDNTKKNL